MTPLSVNATKEWNRGVGRWIIHNLNFAAMAIANMVAQEEALRQVEEDNRENYQALNQQ